MSVQVSKFGNQEDGDGSVPYTEHSESALKHITPGMITNPRPGAAQEDMPPVGAPLLQSGHDSDVQKLKDNPPRRHSASPQRRTMRKTGSNENSAEQSPLHHHQARVANKGGGFPPSERKAVMEGGHGIAPNASAMSRLRPEEGPVVPGIDELNENDPTSGDGFTGIFQKVSDEKQTSATRVPMIIDDSVYLNRYHHDVSNNNSSKFCCFNWGKKRG